MVDVENKVAAQNALKTWVDHLSNFFVFNLFFQNVTNYLEYKNIFQ